MGYPLETTQFSTQHTMVYFPCKWYIVTPPFLFAIYTCNIPLSHIILVIAHSLPWLDETPRLCCHTTASSVNCFTLYFPLLRLCYIYRVFSFLILLYCLHNTCPLVNNPVSDLNMAVNKLQMKYRLYIVEYDVEEVGILCLVCAILLFTW